MAKIRRCPICGLIGNWATEGLFSLRSLSRDGVNRNRDGQRAPHLNRGREPESDWKHAGAQSRHCRIYPQRVDHRARNSSGVCRGYRLLTDNRHKKRGQVISEVHQHLSGVTCHPSSDAKRRLFFRIWIPPGSELIPRKPKLGAAGGGVPTLRPPLAEALIPSSDGIVLRPLASPSNPNRTPIVIDKLGCVIHQLKPWITVVGLGRPKIHPQ